MTGAKTFRENNFDLIRLYAATQVAWHHALRHLQVDHASSLLFQATRLFPGVPIFFFVSGFLISRSHENSSSLGNYARNRFLRIYPALIVCLCAALLAVAGTGYFRDHAVTATGLLAWLAAQSTVMQFYNPDFLRGFGVGALNGSLWTISVELQFYVLTPLLYAALRRLDPKRWNLALASLIVFFALLNRLYMALPTGAAIPLASKLIGVSFLPWFGFFLLGVIFQRNFERLHALLVGRGGVVVVGYALAALFLTRVVGLETGNEIHPLLALLLAATVFSLAYTRPLLAQALLRRNDISYGIYIYHMPVINTLLYLGITGSTGSVLLGLGLAFACAALSWILVEKPCLRRKRAALNPIAPDSEAGAEAGPDAGA